MGDRVSISFRCGKEESVPLFSHWGGMGFVRAGIKYAKSLQGRADGKSGTGPLDRLEPRTAMVDFISKYCKGEEVSSNLYLGKDENDGDNSDNGHWCIDLETGMPLQLLDDEADG